MGLFLQDLRDATLIDVEPRGDAALDHAIPVEHPHGGGVVGGEPATVLLIVTQVDDLSSLGSDRPLDTLLAPSK